MFVKGLADLFCRSEAICFFSHGPAILLVVRKNKGRSFSIKFYYPYLFSSLPDRQNTDYSFSN
ncbi:MAG: hypothetical protein GDA56_27555 [Hormoscilla sp. GM7CHS1pb]|nr:hypothetical protein [Hormoscilla sp. GM7CHS1pb]